MLFWLLKIHRMNFQFLKLVMNLNMPWENSFGGIYFLGGGRISETESSLIAN